MTAATTAWSSARSTRRTARLVRAAVDGGDRGVAHLVVAGRGDELDAGASQCALARGRALLLADEAGHARDDEEEERCRGDDEDEHVGVAERLASGFPGAIRQARAEQGEPERRQWCARIGGRLLERPHRRVQRSRAPEEVVEDPAGVVDQLVVVRVLEERVVVGGVGASRQTMLPTSR